MSLPQVVPEMHQVVPLFVEAVLGEEDSDDLAAMLVPNRHVHLVYRYTHVLTASAPHVRPDVGGRISLWGRTPNRCRWSDGTRSS